MGLFYKRRYRCKKCGTTHAELPTYCSCGTQLSFICPCNMWNVNAEFQPTIDCEEIKQSIFSFGKKQTIEELQNKVKHLESELAENRKEIKELRFEKANNDNEISIMERMISDLTRDNSSLLQKVLMLNKIIEGHENKSSIPQGTIEAVKYALKHSHPDNGGNADDFIRFQKVYEELTRK